MTQLRIRWTSSQIDKLVLAYIGIINQDIPGYRLANEHERVGSGFITSNLKRAQAAALESDYWRNSITKEQAIDLSQRVSFAIWDSQVEEDAKVNVLKNLPVNSLLEELASRMTDSLVDRLIARLEEPLMVRLEQRLIKMANDRFNIIEERAKHNPQMLSEARVAKPHYVVIGLIAAQVQSVVDDFADQAEFTFIDTDAVKNLAAQTRGKIVFCSRFVNHSHWNVVRNNAAEAHFVQGHVKELKTLIRGKISEWQKLNNGNNDSAN